MDKVLVVVVTGLVGFLGLLWGKRLEREHWLRDRRLQAYAQLIAYIDQGLVAMPRWNIRLTRATRDADVDVADELRDFHAEMDPLSRGAVVAKGLVVLLGPAEVASRAAGAVSAFEHAVHSVVEAALPEDKGGLGRKGLVDAMTQAAQATERLSDVARSEIVGK